MNKAISPFNVVTFPNIACGATNGFNGTCYTASECSAKSGSASGSCASSFGVCCVFSIACGATSSANNSYAIMSSYSTSSESDPCTYTFCKTNSDVCKLRIDFDTMELAGPFTIPSPATDEDGQKVGDCGFDTLTISNPGGPTPPTICGTNPSQHMFLATSSCISINIDIDTGTTTTTRKWQIKVSQFDCGSMNAPDQDCLQYHTAASGTIASFNWDTSTTTVSSSQLHLSSQFYDICIRRAGSKCAVCFDPVTATSATATPAISSSYGVGGSSVAAIQTAAVGSICTGVTTQLAAAYGDYLEIANLVAPTTAGQVVDTTRICGAFFNADTTATSHSTACSFAIPFKVGVHFDSEESILATTAANLEKSENDALATLGAGYGYSGFWLNYWQLSC